MTLVNYRFVAIVCCNTKLAARNAVFLSLYSLDNALSIDSR